MSKFQVAVIVLAISSLSLVACSGDERPTNLGTAIVPYEGEAAATSGETAGNRSATGAAANPGTAGLSGNDGAPLAGAGGSTPTLPGQGCRPIKSSEMAPARAEVISADTKSIGRKIYTRELHSRYLAACGSCHAARDEGGLRVPLSPTLVDVGFMDVMTATDSREQEHYEAFRSSDPDVIMPPLDAPGGKLWSERGEHDPVRALDALLTAWYKAGSPPDYFYAREGEDDGVRRYQLSEQIGSQLSNLGSCMPAVAAIGTAKAEMEALDTKFAALTVKDGDHTAGLPTLLHETDIVSFDSEVLAKTQVISFAPAYPLFSDDTYEASDSRRDDPEAARLLGENSLRKMRHVRVPSGKSIVFNKSTQKFEIPDNTRFYKTFTKKVLDREGRPKYRKIETRIIVVRKDGAENPDGSHETRSLYGTYAWDENETEARLVQDPQRDGKPFLDRLVTYVTDEALAEKVKSEIDPTKTNELSALLRQGAARSYAIPGATRCEQCHMGSPSESFILGFSPLQIVRRDDGTGGTYDHTEGDELTQMQRLIAYKVITGVTSAADILPLEKSQAPREPRNEHELKAQGYMVGNCANCHNPRGYASVLNLQLRSVLNFLPSADTDKRGGGIFEFPLKSESPRISRDKVPVRYITPSLVDIDTLPVNAPYLPPMSTDAGLSGQVEFLNLYVAAPWSSLIYRNVDTPFLNVLDTLMLPHMPMNAPGFDRRLPQIMGSWMTSIPARLTDDDCPGEKSCDVPAVRYEEFEEVRKDDPDYENAVTAAKARLKLYREGGVASDLPPEWSIDRFIGTRYTNYQPNTSDIVSGSVPKTEQDLSGLPNLIGYYQEHPEAVGTDPLYSVATTLDQTPDKPRWIVTDFTDFGGDWVPRRPDWADAVVNKEVEANPTVPEGAAKERAFQDEKSVVEMLPDIRLSARLRDYALKPRPFGVWKWKQGCSYASQQKISDFQRDSAPLWMREGLELGSHPLPAGSTPGEAAKSLPVYMLSPAAMVYQQICGNCHGRNYDSRGRLADNLMLVTGGDTRVANFRDGLFGPASSPGAQRAKIFGAIQSTTPAEPDDWAARYFSWMALGGTRSVIDPGLLGVVATTDVLGEKRYPSPVTDANMLAVAREQCRRIQEETQLNLVDWKFEFDERFIEKNGDLDTWLSICSFETERAVTVLDKFEFDGQGRLKLGTALNKSRGFVVYHPDDASLVTAVLGDQGMHVATGLSQDNSFAWCITPPETADFHPSTAATPDKPWVESQENRDLRGAIRQLASLHGTLPICPESWFTNPNLKLEAEKWEEFKRKSQLRASITAGMSVFLYLDKLSKDTAAGTARPLLYDECELLPGSAAAAME